MKYGNAKDRIGTVDAHHRTDLFQCQKVSIP